MAYYESATDTVVARILYDGLGLSGKTSSLRQIQHIFSSRSGPLYVPEERQGRTLYFDWLELEAGRIGEHRLRVQLMTVPGQWVYVQRRWTLLQAPDAIIAVIDSSPAVLNRGLYAMRFLRAALSQRPDAAPLVVQANKQDLPGALRALALRALLDLDEQVPVVESSAESGDGIRTALVLAIQAAREHIRRQLGGRGPEHLPPLTDTPVDLYDQMRQSEAERGDLLEGEVLAGQILGDEEE